MAFHSTCARCGKNRLSVRRHDQRWCIDCAAEVEFRDHPGASRRRYLSNRIRKDDAKDDLAALVARLVNGKGWIIVPPWIE